MKRIAALVVSLTLLFGVAMAAANDFNLSEMSFDELFELQNAIWAEWESRISDSKGMIHSGEYVIGKDIKPGHCNFIVTDVQGVGNINIKSPDTKVGYKISVNAFVGSTIELELIEGEKLVVYRCDAIVQFVDKPAWMP